MDEIRSKIYGKEHAKSRIYKKIIGFYANKSGKDYLFPLLFA